MPSSRSFKLDSHPKISSYFNMLATHGVSVNQSWQLIGRYKQMVEDLRQGSDAEWIQFVGLLSKVRF